jgi:phosphonate transport system substrate-binding protein
MYWYSFHPSPRAATLRLVLVALTGLLMAFGCAAAAADRNATLVIGRVSDNPREDIQRLRPMLDYVVPKLRRVGIERGEILLARDPVQLRNYLRRGRVDWVTETAAMAAMLGADADAQPLLRAMRDNEGAYRSVIFVRRDSGIESIDQLLGRRIALQIRSSTSAFYLPLLMLRDAGLPIVELASPDDTPAPGEIGFVMARSELNVATWVEKGLADAGAFSNRDWGNPTRMPESFRNHMRLIAQSDDVPRAVELVRPDLDPLVRDGLSAALLAAGDDPAADQALRAFFGTTRFVPIEPESAEVLAQLGIKVLSLRREVE